MGGIDWAIQQNKNLEDLDNFVGEKFYRDYSNGSDDAIGSEDRPLKTLQAAIDLCEDGRGDIIVCKPGGEEVTTPVLFNKKAITVISSQYGANPYAMGELFSVYAAASLTDEPAGIVTERCKIVGLGFASRDVGATFYSGAALLIGGEDDATPFGAHLLGCRFPKWGLDNRIGLAIEGGSDILIEECGFEGVGADFDAGIYLQGASQNITFLRNHFRDCTYAIEFGAFAGGGPECIIKENVMQGSKFLNVPSAATGFVIHNWSPYATNAATYNTTVNALQALGLNFSDNKYSDE